MNGLIRNRNAIPELLTWCSAIILVATGTVLAGSGDLRSAAVVIAGFVGIFLLLRPSLSLWFVITGGLILAGVTQLYFPQFQFVRWSIGLLATLLGVVALCKYLFRDIDSEHKYLPPIFWCMTAFIGIAVVSSVLNYDGLNSFAFGFKGYFQVWGLFFALLMMGWQPRIIDRIPKVLIAIAFIQIPFALHQYLYLVPARRYLGHGVVAEDVVAGTLGASATGGGANAVLSVLLLIALSILAALYKRKLLSPQRLFVAALVLLLPILFNANRISLVYLVLTYLMLFSREVWRRPMNTLAIAMLSSMFLLAIFWSYSAMLSRAGETSDWQTYIAQAVARNTSGEYGHGGYELNRGTALTFWAQEHRDASLDKLLFGHGVGAAREAASGVFNPTTLANRDYAGMGIGLTAASAVLWELGIFGLTLLLCIFWVAYRSAGWLGRYYEADVWKAAVFEALRVGVVILAITWFHQDSFVFHLPYQTLFLLIVGYLGYWHSKARADMTRRRRVAASSGDINSLQHS